MDAHVGGVQRFELVELALLGVQAEHRLIQEPVQGDRADAFGDRRDLLVEQVGHIAGWVCTRWAIRRARQTGT